MTESNDHGRRQTLKFLASLSGVALSLSYAPSLLAATGAKAVPSRKPQAPRFLMIDPGHGGRDPGALGRSGTREKDITLDIARRMASAISAMPGMKAGLTRDTDEFIPLQDRVKLGRKAGADLFLSLHADSAPNPAARGLSVYTLSEKASDDFSRLIADKENEADMMGGMDLPAADKEVTAILFDLVARRTRDTSLHAKSQFVQSLDKGWRLLENPMRSANFMVLRAPDMPSMLVETGFLSNPQDEKILSDPRQREKIARLMSKNIQTILKSSLFG